LSKANINSQEPKKIHNVATKYKPMLHKREKLIGIPHSKPFIADDEEKENKTSNNMGFFVPTSMREWL
jgi:hypothetical protein